VSRHTVTADDTAHAGDPAYTSDTLVSGQRFTHTFLTPGDYTYHCAIHPEMKGIVIVR
jgi:plastocyanin